MRLILIVRGSSTEEVCLRPHIKTETVYEDILEKGKVNLKERNDYVYRQIVFDKPLVILAWQISGKSGKLNASGKDGRGIVTAYTIKYLQQSGSWAPINNSKTGKEMFTTSGNLAEPEALSNINLANPIKTQSIRMFPQLWEGIPYYKLVIKLCNPEDMAPRQNASQQTQNSPAQANVSASQAGLNGQQKKIKLFEEKKKGKTHHKHKKQHDEGKKGEKHKKKKIHNKENSNAERQHHKNQHHKPSKEKNVKLEEQQNRKTKMKASHMPVNKEMEKVSTSQIKPNTNHKGHNKGKKHHKGNKDTKHHHKSHKTMKQETKKHHKTALKTDHRHHKGTEKHHKHHKKTEKHQKHHEGTKKYHKGTNKHHKGTLKGTKNHHKTALKTDHRHHKGTEKHHKHHKGTRKHHKETLKGTRKHHKGTRKHHKGSKNHHKGSKNHHKGSKNHHKGTKNHHKGTKNHQKGSKNHHKGTMKHYKPAHERTKGGKKEKEKNKSLSQKAKHTKFHIIEPLNKDKLQHSLQSSGHGKGHKHHISGHQNMMKQIKNKDFKDSLKKSKGHHKGQVGSKQDELEMSCQGKRLWRYSKTSNPPKDEFSAVGDTRQAWRAMGGLHLEPFLFKTRIKNRHQRLVKKIFLQVNFKDLSKIFEIRIGGKNSGSKWGCVTKFVLLYKLENQMEWIFYKDHYGATMVFKMDKKSKKSCGGEQTFKLPVPLVTSSIRLFPKTWSGKPYIHVNFLTCKQEGVTCVKPLLANGRLKRIEFGDMDTNLVGRNSVYYVSVTLNHNHRPMQVKAVKFKQGPPHNAITKFVLQYHDDEGTWYSVNDKDGEIVIYSTDEIVNKHQPMVAMFDKPIITKSIRIYPQAWNGHAPMVMLDFLGCKSKIEP